MALSNAERQARYRDRLKAAARSGVPDRHRSAVSERLADIRSSVPDYSPYGAALDMVSGEFSWRDVVAPIALDLLGLPADPWPGLTYEALVTMVGKRKRDATRRGLPIHTARPEELSLEDKIRAALHREWLESP